MNTKTIRLAALLIVMLPMGMSAAANLVVDGSGQLIGATHVDVNGTLYDVTFMDGTCIALFSDCDDPSDFTFQNQTESIAASQALLDQVFLDGALLFDTDPELTAGCTSVFSCNVYTPYDIQGTTVLNSRAVNVRPGNPTPDFVSPFGGLPPDFSLTGGSSFPAASVWALWTLSQTVLIDFENFQIGDDIAVVNSITSSLGATFDEGSPQAGGQFEVATDPNNASSQLIESPTNASEADILINFSVPVDLVRITHPVHPEGAVGVSLCASDVTGTAANDPCNSNDVDFDDSTAPAVLEVSAPTIRSVSLESASGGIFFDNVEFRPAPDPRLVSSYNLNSTFSDDLGFGPAIVPNGGALESNGYSFGPNQGLSLGEQVLNPAFYSIEMVFSVDDTAGGGITTKFIDFANLTEDAGWYTGGSVMLGQNGPLAFSGAGLILGPTVVFENDKLIQIVVTRDGTNGEIVGYANGVEQVRFTDDLVEGDFSGPDNVAQFFKDDVISGQVEASGGFVDYINIYDRALTPAQVAALVPDADGDGEGDFTDNCPSVFNPDQLDSSMPPDGTGDACVDPSVVIPPNADVDPTATVGANTEIDQNVTVGADTNVGSDVALDQGVSVGSGVDVGDGAELDKNVSVGDGASIGPGVMLGQGVFVGPGAVIGANSIIGKNTVICGGAGVGADSVLGKNNFVTVVLPANTTLGGINGPAPNPADCP